MLSVMQSLVTFLKEPGQLLCKTSRLSQGQIGIMIFSIEQYDLDFGVRDFGHKKVNSLVLVKVKVKQSVLDEIVVQRFVVFLFLRIAVAMIDSHHTATDRTAEARRLDRV